MHFIGNLMHNYIYYANLFSLPHFVACFDITLNVITCHIFVSSANRKPIMHNILVSKQNVIRLYEIQTIGTLYIM